MHVQLRQSQYVCTWEKKKEQSSRRFLSLPRSRRILSRRLTNAPSSRMCTIKWSFLRSTTCVLNALFSEWRLTAHDVSCPTKRLGYASASNVGEPPCCLVA